MRWCMLVEMAGLSGAPPVSLFPCPPPIKGPLGLADLRGQSFLASAVSHYTAMQPFSFLGQEYLTPVPQGTGGVGEPQSFAERTHEVNSLSMNRSSSLTRLEE